MNKLLIILSVLIFFSTKGEMQDLSFLDTFHLSDLESKSPIKTIIQEEQLHHELMKTFLRHQKRNEKMSFDYDDIQKFIYASQIDVNEMYSEVLNCNPWHYQFYRSLSFPEQNVSLFCAHKNGNIYTINLTRPNMSIALTDETSRNLMYYNAALSRVLAQFKRSEVYMFGFHYCYLDSKANKILCLDKNLEFKDVRKLLDDGELFNLNIPECK